MASGVRPIFFATPPICMGAAPVEESTPWSIVQSQGVDYRCDGQSAVHLWPKVLERPHERRRHQELRLRHCRRATERLQTVDCAQVGELKALGRAKARNPSQSWCPATQTLLRERRC